MKRIRNLSLAAFATLAITAAVGATAASASEFVAGKYTATITSTENSQTLTTRAVGMGCTTKAEASLTSQAPTLRAGLSGSCSFFGENPVAMHGCEFIYRPGAETSSNHYGGSSDISCPAGQSIQVSAGGFCTIKIPAQTGLTTNYENLGSGSTGTVKVNLEATHLKYTQEKVTTCETGTFEDGTLSGGWTLQGSNGGSQTGLRLTHKGAISIGGSPPKLTAASYPVTLVGAQNTTQKFALQYGNVTCEKVNFISGPLNSTSELPVGAEYSGCLYGGTPATVRMNLCSYVFNVENAGPPYVGKESISCIGGNLIEIVATAAGKVKCTATIGAQATNAGGLSFTNEASTIGLGFSVSGISYHQQAGEGLGACTTGNYTGTYTGSSILTGYL